MSMDSSAIEFSSGDVVSLESVSNSNIAVSSGVKFGIGADLLESKTETLIMEPSSDNHRGCALENLEKIPIDDSRVSGDERGIVLENVEKGSVDEARVSGDERGIVLDNVEKGSIDEARASGDERGILLENVEKGSIDESRVSGVERGIVLDNVEKGSIDEARVSGDERGILLENVDKGSIDEARVSGNERGIVLQNVEKGSIDDARVSGDERGIVLENVEKGSTDDARASADEGGIASENVEKGLIEDAKASVDEGGIVSENVEKGSVDDARVSGDEGGIVLENVEKALIDDARVSVGEGGIVLENVEKCSIDDARVFGDEVGIVLENIEKGSIDDTRVIVDEGGTVSVNVEKGSIDDARVSGDEGGIVSEPVEKGSTDDATASIDEGGIVSDNVEKGSIDDARVSGNEIGIALENVEKSSIDDARISGDEIGIVLENVEKCSIDDARVSGDEIGTVLDNAETLDENGVSDEEKEGEYKVSDLVWAKVKSYPWWPGQIIDPSGSSNKAKKYSKKNGFLIAYFGDHSFAWNDASKIKPFRKNFVKMEKQSNTKSFFKAVNCALDEVSRRVEFGLACSCLSEDAYNRIKTQVFVNAGIRKEFSRIDGGDNFSTVATFKPADIVQSVQDLAKEHFDGISRLEVSCVRSQLLAFFCWKGYYQFPSHHLLDEPDTDNKTKDNAELQLTGEDKVVEDSKPDSPCKKVLSKKRKVKACDQVRNSGMIARKKEKREERSLKRSIPNDSSSVPNRDDKVKNGKRKTVESNGSGDRNSSISSPKKLFRVGDSICKIARQLSQSPMILKKESQKSETQSGKTHVDQTEEENSATALILKFTNLDSVPSLSNLNEIFSRYEGVRETETEVLKKSKCAKVVFETQSNAEAAFSSAGKLSLFGSALVSYRLDYSPKKKDAGIQFEESV